MRVLNRIFAAILITFIGWSLQSCYYDNKEELYGVTDFGCDTSLVTYSEDIAPVLQSNCDGCHGSSTAQANVITDNYTDLKQVLQKGRFLGSINHESGFSPMPKNAEKISDCNLIKIRIWIDEGAQNN